MASSTPLAPATEQSDNVIQEAERIVAMLAQLMTAVRLLNSAATPQARREPAFPRYLLPSLRIPLRRPRISEPADTKVSPSSLGSSPSSEPPSLSTSPTSPTSPAAVEPSPLQNRLSSDPCPHTLRCSRCAADFAYHAQIVSKAFFGRHGRAYLVAPLPAPGHPPPPSWWPVPLHVPGTAADPSLASEQETESEEPGLLNVRIGTPEERLLATGLHTVADVSCLSCGQYVGWKYIAARNQTQKYKVGKFILETGRVVKYQPLEDETVIRETDGAESRDGVRAKRRVSYAPSRRRSSAMFETDDVEEDVADSDNERSGLQRGLGKGGSPSDAEVVVFDSEDESECDDIFAGIWDPTVAAQRRRSKAASGRGRIW
jgi:hypothetical protein